MGRKKPVSNVTKEDKEQEVVAGSAKINSDETTAPVYSVLSEITNTASGITGLRSSFGSFEIEPFPTILSSPEFVSGSIRLPSVREQELEGRIDTLKGKIGQLQSTIETKTEADETNKAEIAQLRKTIEELDKEQGFKYLLYRVNEKARDKLLESEGFRQLFEQKEKCEAGIMSVDIRRSTELMLKARSPQLYAEFIRSLCVDLTNIILERYGIFDKFTGDGILAFFPDFYSGDDALYWAIEAAEACHGCFNKHYGRNRNSFNSVLLDVGLGIGIDWGDAHLIRIQDSLTVIGTPVVYACRMSGAEAGQTLLNQPAYEKVSEKFGRYVNCQESATEIKHEGNTLAYLTTISEKTYTPKLPSWLCDTY